jgi:hypothetical protein
MFPLARIILLATLTLGCATFASAQYKACANARPSPFKHNAQIVTVYDARTKGMKVTLEHPTSLTKSGDPLYLYAEFYYQDPKLGIKPNLNIYLVSTSKETLYRNARNLTLTVDGMSLPMNGPVQYDSKKVDGGKVREMTKITLTYEALVSLIRGKRVEGQLGPTEIRFTNNHLEALREIASMMVPSGGRTTYR